MEQANSERCEVGTPIVQGPVTCHRPVRPQGDSTTSEPAVWRSWDERNTLDGRQGVGGGDGAWGVVPRLSTTHHPSHGSFHPLSSPPSSCPHPVACSSWNERRKLAEFDDKVA